MDVCRDCGRRQSAGSAKCPECNSQVCYLHDYIHEQEACPACEWAGRMKALAEVEDLVGVALREMPYPQYLLTDHWQALRVGALKRAGFRCQVCNVTGVVLNVHHRTYERLGQERDDDLTVLCRGCHALFHRKLEA